MEYLYGKKKKIDVEQVKALYNKGYGAFSIARKFFVSAPTILKILKREGIFDEKRSSVLFKRKIAEEEFEKYIKQLEIIYEKFGNKSMLDIMLMKKEDIFKELEFYPQSKGEFLKSINLSEVTARKCKNYYDIKPTKYGRKFAIKLKILERICRLE